MPFGGLQPWHLLVIVIVALLIFGPSRIPEVGKSIGQSIREFREAAANPSDTKKSSGDESEKPPTKA